jgi:hypothetical protein
MAFFAVPFVVRLSHARHLDHKPKPARRKRLPVSSAGRQMPQNMAIPPLT